MNVKTIFLGVVLLSFSVTHSEAGGVVKARENAMRQAQQRKAQEQKQHVQQKRAQQQASTNPRDPSQVLQTENVPSEVLDITQIWDELQVSTEIWPMILDRQPKEVVINQYIDWYKEQGIFIRKSASLYVDLIDDISRGNDQILKNPFKNILRVAAIMEYDFDNGQDKERMALQVLGEKVYQENKERLNKK